MVSLRWGGDEIQEPDAGEGTGALERCLISF